MKFLLSSNPDDLQATNPDATVEAEYGDVVVTGTVLTMAHHGPRTGQPAPCSYANGCGPGVEVVGLSHVDLDTIGGCLAILGRKPEAPSFWALAEYVDLNGAHKLGLSGGSVKDIRRLRAYWAFNEAMPAWAPRDGSVLDVTATVQAHADAVLAILDGAEGLLSEGDAHEAGEGALNAASFSSIEGGVILRTGARFVNHLYVTPAGQIGRAVVTHNPAEDVPMGAITLSFAGPEAGCHAGEILRGLFGPEAGGHAGIGGSPRGKPLPGSGARDVAREVRRLLAAQ